MINPYHEYLNEFFSTLLEYRHSTNRLNTVLKNDAQNYLKENSQLFLGSALIISDWSGPSDQGWEINFHTGIFKKTLKSTYELEVKNIISRECCLMYAQSFEAFERFLKDCLFDKASREEELKSYIINFRNKKGLSFSRETMPGGENLFKILKKAGGKTYIDFSKANNIKVKFSELWTILSEARHSITHSRSILKTSKINQSIHHSEIFYFLFDFSIIDGDFTLIKLDYHKFNQLIKRLSEFAFQILKILSIEEGANWKLYK